MKREARAVALAIVGAMVGGVTPFAAFGQPPLQCAAPHRLSILDLGMIPDPVRQGQRVQLWTVNVQSDYTGECRTVLEVRDQDRIAGRGVEYLIKTGVGRYTVQAVPGYQFQRQDQCFVVRAAIGNTWNPVGARRAFCAKLGPSGWSLK